MIQIRNIYKSFGNKPVLRGINLDIRDSETMVILGSSGQGKTVLLKHIVGLFKPDQGEIFVDDIEITSLSEKDLNKVRLQFGVVFQENALFDFLTVKENVGFLFYEYPNLWRNMEVRNSYRIDEKISKILKLVGLEGTERLYPQELSGGMKKRVAIARALVFNPQIIIYDEPTVGIDPPIAKKIDFLIKELHDKLNVTSIVVTHDLHCAFYVSDRIAFMADGSIIFCGTKEELVKSTDLRIKDFVESFYGVK